MLRDSKYNEIWKEAISSYFKVSMYILVVWLENDS
jgi:hypothetical protein